jgi:hypothetical protein
VQRHNDDPNARRIVRYGTLSEFRRLHEPTAQRAYNVAGVIRNGDGDYTVRFQRPMADANYTVSLTAVPRSFPSACIGTVRSQSATELRIQMVDAASRLIAPAKLHRMIVGS